MVLDDLGTLDRATAQTSAPDERWPIGRSILFMTFVSAFLWIAIIIAIRSALSVIF